MHHPLHRPFHERAVTLHDLLYAFSGLVSSPAIAASLLRTGKWRTDWHGRKGYTDTLPADPRPTILVHGVSLGEINATRTLVQQLAGGVEGQAGPLRIVVSATTDTGFARAQELYGGSFDVVRFPLDLSWMVRRFLDAVQPAAVALVELELWPNFSAECRRRGIPVAVVNGRLSDSSYGRYRRFGWLMPGMFENLAAAGVQTEEYAQRFRTLGTPSHCVTVTDTMKWDTARIASSVPGADALAGAMGFDADKPLVVAGSTGPGEEALLLASRPNGVQLALAPRKPERFEEVARLVPGAVRRSLHPDGGACPEETSEVFLIDTLGELAKAYSLADVAVVGRSFVRQGGSDPIEPVALGIPTVTGPHHDNFRDVVQALESAGALIVTDDPMGTCLAILSDEDRAFEMKIRGPQVVRDRQGASERNARLVRDIASARVAHGPRPRDAQ